MQARGNNDGAKDPRPLARLDDLWRKAAAADEAGDDVARAQAWDAVIGELGVTTSVPSDPAAAGASARFVEALHRRLAVPLRIPMGVLAHASPLLGSPGDFLAPTDQAFVNLVVALTFFAHGHAAFADVLGAAETMLDLMPDDADIEPGSAPAAAMARSLGHLVSVEVSLGAYTDAMVVVERAERLLGLASIERLPQEVVDRSIAALLSGVNTPTVELGGSDFPEAVNWIRQLRADLLVELGDGWTGVAIYQSLSCAYGRLDGWAMVVNAAEALRRLDRNDTALELLAALDPAHRATHGAEIELIEALATFANGDVDVASRLVDRVAAHINTNPNIELRDDVLALQAQIAVQQADRSTAVDRYQRYLQATLALRAVPLGYRLDSMALRDVYPHVAALAALLAESEDGAGLLAVIEAMKGVHLRTVLLATAGAGANAPERSTGRPDAGPLQAAYRQQIERCTAEIQQLRRALANQPASRAEMTRDALIRDLEDRRAERQALMASADRYDPLWATMTQGSVRGPDELLGAFRDSRTAGLTLMRFDTQVRSVLIDGNGFHIGQTALDGDTTKALGRFVRNLVAQTQMKALWDPLVVGLDVDQFVPPELWERACAADALVIAAHRELHLLPWPMVPRGGGRLLEDVAVCVAPSLSCVPAMSRALPSTRRLAAFGPPAGWDPRMDELAGAAHEVEEAFAAVEAASPSPWQQGAGATTAALTALLSDATVTALHIASHAISIENEPWSSGVITSDGALDAAALRDLRNITPEIVASACTTGWRPAVIGDIELLADDCLGLPAAFLVAGARALLVSISPLGDDDASSLLTSYHRRRQQGDAPVHAFRAAQREALDKPGDVHLWCGLTLYAAPYQQPDQQQEVRP